MSRSGQRQKKQRARLKSGNAAFSSVFILVKLINDESLSSLHIVIDPGDVFPEQPAYEDLQASDEPDQGAHPGDQGFLLL